MGVYGRRLFVRLSGRLRLRLFRPAVRRSRVSERGASGVRAACVMVQFTRAPFRSGPSAGPAAARFMEPLARRCGRRLHGRREGKADAGTRSCWSLGQPRGDCTR